jgi:hypothetical protein
MPKEFRGEFLWRKQNAVLYAVTLKIAEIEEANNGNLIFKGLHVYQPGNYIMKVKGTIDLRTRHISILYPKSAVHPQTEDSRGKKRVQPPNGGYGELTASLFLEVAPNLEVASNPEVAPNPKKGGDVLLI